MRGEGGSPEITVATGKRGQIAQDISIRQQQNVLPGNEYTFCLSPIIQIDKLVTE